MANFQVFIYPNDWALWDDAQTVEDGLMTFAGLLQDYGSITSYEIDIRIDMPDVADYDAFETWRRNNHSDHGAHLWLTGSYGEGRADSGNTYVNAWNSPMDAKIHTSTADYHGFKKELAIQESLHPHLWSPATDQWTDGDEHDLGSIRHVDGAWRATPMACSYTESRIYYGNCRPYFDFNGYTVKPTHCTKEAIQACNPRV